MRRGWLFPASAIVMSALVLQVAPAGAEGKETIPGAPDPCTEHIAYQVDEAGFFNAGVGTDGQCQPQSGAWDLLYRWPSGPGTSYTTVKTETGTYVLGRDVHPNRAVDAAPGGADTLSEREYLLPSGLRVIQRLEIDDGFTPNRPDSLKITYEIENPTSDPQPAELRVMLDTELNYNDGAPFQIPGHGAVTAERSFSGADVPDFYVAFADFQDPVHIGAGVLRTPGEIAPARVVFGTWPNLYDNEWDVTTDPFRPITRDSAVAVYFRPPSTGAKIPPRESVTYTTRYGRASASSDLRPPLSISMLAPAQAAVGSPFRVTAYITNVGDGPATNGYARLYVPPGFSVADPDTSPLTSPLPVNVTRQVTWTVTAAEPSLVGAQEISVATGADNAAEKVVTRPIDIFTAGRPITTYPLLGAHGITGQASDMDPALRYADQIIWNLSGTDSVPTGANTSVWTNGQTIVDYTRTTLLPKTGAPKANILAHSKGGLDSRVAMHLAPELFDTLGMLATPNGGSAGADKLCFIRRLPWGGGFQQDMGPCDTDADGLFNLQTGYMKTYFNVIVSDNAQHLKLVAAGDCTGMFRPSCNEMTQLLDCQPDADNHVHSDELVCVESAFARTTKLSDGLALALEPVFDLDHTGMRLERCPVTRVVSEMYPLDSPNNPWLTPGACWPSSSARAAAMPAAPTAPAPFFGSAATADQVPQMAGATPASPATFTVNPEGGDRARATVVLPAGVNATVTVSKADGTPDPDVAIAEVDLFGDTGYDVTLPALAGQPRLVHVAPDKSAQVGILTTVLAHGMDAKATLTPGIAGAASRVTVSLSGVNAAAAKAGTVTVAWPDNGHRRTATLAFDAATSTFYGAFTPPAGTFVPVDIAVNVDGRSRMLPTGLTVPDGSGSFTGVGSTSLLDVDGDGHPDVFRIPTGVEVNAPGDYHVGVDLVSGGNPVLTVEGSAQLRAGTGVVNVDVPVASLLLVGADGPFDVNTAILTEGRDTRRIVAQQATLGRTGPFQIGQVSTPRVALSRPTTHSVDIDRDGRYELLRFKGSVSVPAAGDFLLSAQLRSPQGQVVGNFEQTVTLQAGRPTYTIEFPGELIGTNGSGRYMLTGLRLTAITDQQNTDSAHPVQTGHLDASRWVGGSPNITTLIEMWNAAQATGGISPFGAYVSQVNRLERVAKALDGANTRTARAELAAFLDAVDHARGIVTDWRFQITGYATALRDSL